MTTTYDPKTQYEHDTICPNCGEENKLSIPKGQTIVNYKRSHRCFYCGCLLSGKATNFFNDPANYQFVDGLTRKTVRNRKCNICGRKMLPVYKGVGFPHLIQTDEILYWNCDHCENKEY